MKYVLATDSRGYTRRFLVRDTDGDEDALSGVPSGPPDLDEIDWDSIKRDINNQLAERGLFTWEDIQKSPDGISLVATIVKRWVAGAYKEDYALAKKASQSS